MARRNLPISPEVLKARQEARREELEELSQAHYRYYGEHLTPQQIEHYMKHGTFGANTVAMPPEDKKKRKQ